MLAKRKIKDFLLDYGCLPVIFAFEDFILEENYEACQLIKEVIDEFNQLHNGNIPYSFKEALIYENEQDEYTIKKIPEHAKKLKDRLCK